MQLDPVTALLLSHIKRLVGVTDQVFTGLVLRELTNTETGGDVYILETAHVLRGPRLNRYP